MTLQCPDCHRENQPSSRFCIYCGNQLLSTETGDSRRPSQDVQDEIQRLRKLISQITNRLDALELRQGIVETPSPPETAPVEEVAESTPAEPAAVEPVPEHVQAPAEPVVEVPALVTAPVMAKPPRREREWEQILGGSWLARIGVLALVIGIIFFLKYAFDNDWLGPAGRVILGIVGGLLMLGAGYRWRNRYPIMTRVLSGGGIAVLYASVFASFALYELVHFYAALAFLFAVSIASALIALRYDSMSLAVLGIIGAFLAPFLLGAFRETGTGIVDSGQAVQLLAYIIVVDIGVLVLATFRNWRWFTLLALFCSLVSFGVWYGEFDRSISAITAETGITIIFVIFVGATTLFHILWRRIVPRSTDFGLMMVNAAAYFGITLGLMWDDYRGWLGLHVFLMAALYGLVSYLAYRRHAESPLLSRFAMGIGIIFLTVAIPLQIGDKAWATIAWAAEGAVLIWLASRSKIDTFRYFSYFVFAAVTVRLMAFDTVVEIASFQPVFNERFLAFIVSIAALGTATYFSWKNRGEEKDYEYLVFLGAANFFTMWLIAAEAYTYSQQAMSTNSSLSLIVLVFLAAVALFHRLAWQQKLLRYDLIIVLFNTLVYIIASVFLWDDLRAWMGLLYFVLAAFYGILTYVAYRRSGENSLLGLVAMGITVAFLATAFAIQLGNTVWTTIAWAIEFLALVWLSFRFGMPQLRNYSYAVFLFMVGRLLFFDTGIDIRAFRPVFNERFLAYIIGIAATYLAVYLLWRHRESFPEWHVPALPIIVIANFLTIWILSFEVWQSFSKALLDASPAAVEGLRDAQNLSLTAVWAVYAVAGLVIGIWKRWRYIRLGALALLVVPIVKVFVYDVFQLDLGYRIGAFVGLGVLLLVSAYLYQRYSKVIKGVFTEG
jgi:uncharacterized membrane protein